MQIISTSAAADNAAFFAAIANAERRALHSYFDQHVVADEEAGYITIDEGDYGALPEIPNVPLSGARAFSIDHAPMSAEAKPWKKAPASPPGPRSH